MSERTTLQALTDAADADVPADSAARASAALSQILYEGGLAPGGSTDVAMTRAFALGMMAADHYNSAPRRQRRKQQERKRVLRTVAARRGWGRSSHAHQQTRRNA